jgi:ATP-dependent helicase/nuclease subunit A
MHCLLEHYVPQQGRINSLWSETAWQLAQSQFGLDAPQMALAAQAAQSIVQGEGAWAWDGEILLWQGNEISIYHEGRNMRMDRLVQRKDTGQWWILDYKSSSRPDANPVLCGQLAGYRAAVQMAYPAATIRAAFLTPQGRLIEPDPHVLDGQEAER